MDEGRTIELLDTTLRDGAQSEGVSFSLQDKIAVVEVLDRLGVPLIEAGNPGSNPKDEELFRIVRDAPPKSSSIVAFGATRRPDATCDSDPQMSALADAGTSVVTLVGKAWGMHIREILRTTPDENERMIRESVAWLVAHGKRVIFDAEHFFFGWKDDRALAMRMAAAAAEAGASVVCLCETNGGAFPEEVAEATRAMIDRLCGRCAVGIHAHDDSGLAVANTIAAVRAGATHVQGTLCGFGERCGNANLATVLANLQLKLGYACIAPERMSLLTPSVRHIAAIANVVLPGGLPYVGRRAFAHKGGMHMDGVRKVASSFEHVTPESVGNTRRFLVSEQAGRSAVIDRIRAVVPEIDRDDPGVDEVVRRLKEREKEGYQYEGADGSFELLIRKTIRPYKPFFALERLRILGEITVMPAHSVNTSAMIKVTADGHTEISAAEGEGPVNALDNALRKALGHFYPRIREMRLTDFKVRIIDADAATAATVRVLIESTDGHRIWTTVGVSYDIIEASWLALVDSVENKLIHDSMES
ncbi:MAG: citramalate synthase [Kiritimatiellae bacterium]|nr:citramalate synthase [Kiritimatiellia bacterium]